MGFFSDVVGGLFGGAKAGAKAGSVQSAAIQKAIDEIREEFGITETEFTPFRQAAIGGPGVTGALTRQQQFLGLMGPQAQQQAFGEFIESPGQAFLRRRGEEALLRNAAAIGGLGGGNVRQALQEQGIGVAAQQQEQLQNRLAQLSGIGFGATGQLGALRGQKASNIGQLLTGQGQARASGILGEQQGQAGMVSNLLGAAGAIGGFFSDERLKEGIEDLDLKSCFDAVVSMPLKSWRYLEAVGLGRDTHFGPMAQEAPDQIRLGEVNGVEMLDLHDELMLLAGAIQYMNSQGMLQENRSCH